MPTQEQLLKMKNVRDTIASGQGASLNANQPSGTVSSGYRPDPVPFAQAGNPTLQKNQTVPSMQPVTQPKQEMTTSAPTPIKPLQTTQPNAPVAPAPLTAAQLEEQDRIASEGLIEGQMKETNKIASQYGLDAGPTSIQEMVDKVKNDKAQAMKYAEEQRARQSALDIAASGRAQRGMEGASAANTAALAQGREGAFSGSAQTVAGEYRTEIQKQIQENNTRLQAAEASRDQQMLELKNAQQSGNTELVSQIQKDLAYANQQVQKTKTDYLNAMSQQNAQSMDLLQILDKNGSLAGLSPDELNFVKQGMPGVPQGIVDIMSKNATSTSASTKAAAEYEQTTKGLKSFTDILSQGGSMTPENIMSLSSSLGIPPEMALSAYSGFSAIRADKTLSAAETQAKIKDLNYDLGQKAKGIFNEAAQNIDTLANMYKNGASAEMISNFKSAAKITDDSDPMYQADLAYKQAQTEYSKSQTAESYATLKEKEQDWLALNGESPGGYLPNKSLEGITSEFKDGKLKINSKTPYQCGAFVNRFWGLGAGTKENGGMPSSLADKTAAVKRNGVEKGQINEANFFNVVKPGMAFVTTYEGTGHTGIVTAVYKDGTYDTMEANIGDKNPNTPDPARPGHRSWKDANLVGFARPPEGKATEMKGGKEDTAMKKYYNEALLSGLPPSAAKKIATEKTVEDLKKEEDDGKVSEQDRIATNQLRTQFDNQPAVKEYKEVRDQQRDFEAVVDGKFSGAGDLALIYGFMKALDPRSVVRGEEFDAAANTGNIFQGTWAKYNGQFKTGEKLPQEVRDQFLAVVNERLKVKEKGFEEEYNRYKNMATEQGLKSNWVVNDYTGKLEQEPPPKPLSRGEFKSKLQTYADSGIHTNDLLNIIYENPMTKESVREMVQKATSPKDYQEIVNYFLQYE